MCGKMIVLIDCVKMVEEGSVIELCEHICSLLPQFLEHCFVKRHQSNTYQKQREAQITGRKNTTALLQLDYSENYSCVYQDEIQSAHCQQNQVTLFTAALWYNGSIHPHVIVSDNKIHAKETILAYVDSIYLDRWACIPIQKQIHCSCNT